MQLMPFLAKNAWSLLTLAAVGSWFVFLLVMDQRHEMRGTVKKATGDLESRSIRRELRRLQAYEEAAPEGGTFSQARLMLIRELEDDLIEAEARSKDVE